MYIVYMIEVSINTLQRDLWWKLAFSELVYFHFIKKMLINVLTAF